MEAVTDKPVENKNFHLRAAFGKMLTEHNAPVVQESIHRYLYKFADALLFEFRRLCAEKNITILRESKKESSHFEFNLLEPTNDE
jgi:hypothetical protein